MKPSRSIDIRDKLITSVRDLYGLAISVHLTWAEINERFNHLFEPYPKLPNHVRQYIRGYRHALDDNLYRNYLQYAYEWEGLVYAANWDTMPEELKEALRKNAPVIHGHYWKKTLRIAGDAKPYFIGSDR